MLGKPRHVQVVLWIGVSRVGLQQYGSIYNMVVV
jgi:hypothetical protein